MRVKGEGMPKMDYPSESGDLLITFVVNLPTVLDDNQKVLLKEYFKK